MVDTLNADFTRRVVMDTAKMEWRASPSPTVWRKRLDWIGGESSRVTSVVRYDPKSSFPEHDHPEGEEILVESDRPSWEALDADRWDEIVRFVFPE